MLLIYLLSSVLIVLYTLVIGLGLTKILKKNFFYFPILFVVFLGGLSLILWSLKLQVWFLFIIPFLFLLWPFYQKVRKLKINERNILLFFLAVYFLYVIIQVFVPFYPLGRNWYHYYKYSLNVSESGHLSQFERNPLFSLIEGAFFTIFNSDFYVAQITTCLIGSFIVFPYFLLSKKFIRSKLITFSLLILIFNPFIVENTLYNWPKMLATMFILYFIWFILKGNRFASYISGVLSFLSHSLSLFFILPIYLISSIEKKEKWIKVFILFFLTVFGIILIKRISGYSSIFIYYPFAVNGWDVLIDKSTGEILQDFLSKPFYYHFLVRFVNLMNTIFPTIPILKLINQFMVLPVVELHRIFDITKVPLIYYYFHSVPGALTIGIYIFVIIACLNKKNLRFILTFMILPLLFAVSFFGWIKGGAIRDTLQPLIPLALILSVKGMGKHNKKIMYLVFLVMIVEMILFFILYDDFIHFSVENLKQIGDYEILRVETINKLIFKRDILVEYGYS